MSRFICFTTPGIALLLCLPSASMALTVLWDFESDPPGALPPGWTNGWNMSDPSCDQFPGDQFCDYQQRPWRVAGGQLVPPVYAAVGDGPDDAEGTDTFADSGVFKSVPPAATSSSGDNGEPVLSVSIPFDPSRLEQGDQVFDGLQVLLLTVGTQLVTTLIDLPLEDADVWIANDQADGVEDGVITLVEPIEPDTEYRLRVRAYDFDLDLGSHDGYGIDSIAVTNGAIVDLAPMLPGDYNDDGRVDAADYVVWRDQLGAPAGTLPNDVDGGPIGLAQYQTWSANFGMTAAPSASLVHRAVPEPASLPMLVSGALLILGRRPHPRRCCK